MYTIFINVFRVTVYGGENVKELNEIYESLKKGKLTEIEVEDGTMLINPQNANLIVLFDKGIAISYNEYHLHLYKCEDKNEICWSIEYNGSDSDE